MSYVASNHSPKHFNFYKNNQKILPMQSFFHSLSQSRANSFKLKLSNQMYQKATLDWQATRLLVMNLLKLQIRNDFKIQSIERYFCGYSSVLQPISRVSFHNFYLLMLSHHRPFLLNIFRISGLLHGLKEITRIRFRFV